jgi:myosin heavy subunit
VVNHYAGSVAYTINEFCEKNKDLLAVDLVQMMMKSKSKFFSQLFENQATDSTPAKPGRRLKLQASCTSRFRPHALAA